MTTNYAPTPGNVYDVRGSNHVRITLPIRITAGMLAFICIALETALNVSGTSSADISLLASTIAAPAIAAIALIIAEHVWIAGARIRAGLVLIAGLSIVLLVILNGSHRATGAQEDGIAAERNAEQASSMARDQIKRYDGEAARYKALADAEQAKGGCGPLCKGQRANQADAEIKAMAARTALASAPAITKAAPESEYWSRITGIDAEWITLVKPLMLPIGLSLAGIFAAGIAAAPTGSARKVNVAPVDQYDDVTFEPISSPVIARQPLRVINGGTASNDDHDPVPPKGGRRNSKVTAAELARVKSAIVARLDHNPKAFTQRALVQEIGTSNGTLSLAINELENAGQIMRASSSKGTMLAAA
jgi:hypothetical protein